MRSETIYKDIIKSQTKIIKSIKDEKRSADSEISEQDADIQEKRNRNETKAK